MMQQKEIKINEDAIHLLAFIKRKNKTSSDEIMNYSKWDVFRITDAVNFLKEEGFIHEPITMASRRIIDIRCTSKGIMRIEKPEDFNNTYGININFNVDSLMKVEIDKIFETKLF